MSPEPRPLAVRLDMSPGDNGSAGGGKCASPAAEGGQNSRDQSKAGSKASCDGRVWRKRPRSPPSTPDDNKWSESFYWEYDPTRPMVPQNLEELDTLLQYVNSHHVCCPIDHFPQHFQDLLELQDRGRRQLGWCWNSYCEGAFRKLECQLFMHALFDEWPLACQERTYYRVGEYPDSLLKWKDWLAHFHYSCVSSKVEHWPSRYDELIQFVRTGEVNWNKANIQLFEELNDVVSYEMEEELAHVVPPPEHLRRLFDRPPAAATTSARSFT